MIYAATGHRPNKLGGYGAFAHSRLVKVASAHLRISKPIMVIVGMAQGWDQAVARACIDLGIPFRAAIPFKGQEKEWPAQAQGHYQFILAHASSIHIVCDGDYEVWKMQKRNEWMVDHCNQVLAIWDGTPGGTANCIRYARSLKRPIVNLYEEWEA